MSAPEIEEMHKQVKAGHQFQVLNTLSRICLIAGFLSEFVAVNTYFKSNPEKTIAPFGLGLGIIGVGVVGLIISRRIEKKIY